jgi:transposase
MVRFDTGEGVVLEEDSQDGEIIARVAALDIGKAELVCCVRIPPRASPGGGCGRL